MQFFKQQIKNGNIKVNSNQSIISLGKEIYGKNHQKKGNYQNIYQAIDMKRVRKNQNSKENYKASVIIEELRKMTDKMLKEEEQKLKR